MVLLAIGTALRVLRFLENRTLWNDEAALAVNVVKRSYASLLQPADAVGDVPYQSAPAVFMWMQKMVVDGWGDHEMSHRLVPLIFSILSLFLFWRLAIAVLGNYTALLALAFYACLEALVFYSAEAKPYSVDLAAAIACTWCGVMAAKQGAGRVQMIMLLMVGLLTPWVSFGSIPILASIGIVLMFRAVATKDQRSMLQLLGVGILWVANILIVIKSSEVGSGFREYVFNWIEEMGANVISLPTTASRIVSLFRTPVDFFVDPMGFYFPGVAFVLAAVGLVRLLHTRRTVALLLLVPFVITVAASLGNFYPFATSSRFAIPLFGRFIFFLVPTAVLLVAAGAAHLLNQRETGVRFAALLSLLLTLGPAVALAGRNAVVPSGVSELRPVLDKVAANARPGDTYYVFWAASFQVLYYKDKYTWPTSRFIPAGKYRSDWQGYEREIASLKGHRRVWFIHATNHDWARVSEERVILHIMDRLGKREMQFNQFNASAYLYDMTGVNAP